MRWSLCHLSNFLTPVCCICPSRSWNSIFSADSVDRLKGKLLELRTQLEDEKSLREIYMYSFTFAKEPGQKSLSLEVALPLWRILLGTKYPEILEWCRFLEVSAVVGCLLKPCPAITASTPICWPLSIHFNVQDRASCPCYLPSFPTSVVGLRLSLFMRRRYPHHLMSCPFCWSC